MTCSGVPATQTGSSIWLWPTIVDTAVSSQEIVIAGSWQVGGFPGCRLCSLSAMASLRDVLSGYVSGLAAAA